MADDNQQDDRHEVQVHVSPDLEYVYRDVVNIFVGNGDVLLEFGNHHRSIPERHVSISDRIVLSVPNAYDMLHRLHKTLQEAQNKIQEQLKKNMS